jgi:hypothetical protein
MLSLTGFTYILYFLLTIENNKLPSYENEFLMCKEDKQEERKNAPLDMALKTRVSFIHDVCCSGICNVP